MTATEAAISNSRPAAGQCGADIRTNDSCTRLAMPSRQPMMIGKVRGPTGSEMKLSSIWVACQMKKMASTRPMPPKMRSLMLLPGRGGVGRAAPLSPAS